jgi:hypothetical protein
MRLGACHTAALRPRAHAAVGLLAIAVRKALRQDLRGPRGHVPMALLHILKKLHQLLIPRLVRILEIWHTRLTALEGVIEHTDDVVRLVSAACLMLSHPRCAWMARHAVVLRPDLSLSHTYRVMVVVTAVCDL